jgi:RNA polymerase sigma-70 factor (ECF subfamily)
MGITWRLIRLYRGKSMKLVKNLIAAYSLKHEFAIRRNKLYQIAYSWCHETALADDLVQDTMYKALKNAANLRDVATMDTWLYRILINCWHDYLRVQGRNVELFDVSDERQPGHDESYQQLQIVERVRASVARLPMSLREVVTLADFSGFSYAEIAKILDVPIGTVMSRLFRARKSLKEQLLDLGNTGEKQVKLRRVK